MNHRNTHTKYDASEFFKKLEVPFEKSKEDVWDAFSGKLDEMPPIKIDHKIVSFSTIKLLAAATVVIALGLTFFLRFHTITIACPKGEHLSHTLPDGSIVDMNAASNLAYHPYWWNINREVTFEGEAFFSIEKGKQFLITSINGSTEILGTSFNIFSRNTDYKVFCKTGKVKIYNDKSMVEMVINPGELGIINNELNLGQIKNIEAENILSWQKNKFNFTSEPLQNVIEEIERQYNIQIDLAVKNHNQLTYTGYFTKSTSIESSLNIICKSFNLNIKKKKEGYKISSKH